MQIDLINGKTDQYLANSLYLNNITDFAINFSYECIIEMFPKDTGLLVIQIV